MIGLMSLAERRRVIYISLSLGLAIVFFSSLLIGSSWLSIGDCLKGLFGIGEKSSVTIMQNVRLPRALAGLAVGLALPLSGAIMQTLSNNVMASPSTLGTNNAATLGANFAIIVLGGGAIASGGRISVNNPYLTSLFAFLFAFAGIMLVLGLAKIRGFHNATTVLLGVAFGAFCSGLVTLLQYFADDTSLATAVYWSFGDLGRASYLDCLLIGIPTLISLAFFLIFSYRYNAILLGEEVSRSLGIKTNAFRFISLLLACLLTAVCVSLVGIIAFIGLIIPQVARKMVGNDHKHLMICSALLGPIVLITCDMITRVMLGGFSMPVGALTSILGAPFFVLFILLRRKKDA